jgi:hypothetical protein
MFGNLLGIALTVIPSQTVMFYKATGRTKTPAGFWQPVFAAGVGVEIGSVQAVARSKYQILGLELSKKYVTWFVPRVAVVSLERDTSGDQFEYNGARYQTESVTDWEAQDGWLEVLAIKIEGAPDA